MSVPTIQFRPVELPASGTLVVFAADGMTLGEGARRADEASDGLITAAAEAQGFKGKRFATLNLQAMEERDALPLQVTWHR